jgi:fused signal recognition particle receptor
MEVVLIVVGVVLVLAVAGFVVVRGRGRGRKAAPEPSRAGPELHAGAKPVTEPAKAPRPLEPARGGLADRIRSLFRGRAPSDDDWRELEETLIRADVGPKVARELVHGVRDRWDDDADPAELVHTEIVTLLDHPARELQLDDQGLSVIMVVGVNGAGKTTSIGKLANHLAAQGRTVCLANSDTFRAAASEQLGVWAGRANVHLVAQERGADPGAVAFDAVRSAQARNADVLIVDTAGRLHTRQPLMDELGKVRRVLDKAAGDVEEVLLVIDGTAGQNGIAQARAFTAAVEITGVILTKLDGTAKGGVVLAVKDELGVPVKLIGTGEQIDDIAAFDPEDFARSLLR